MKATLWILFVIALCAAVYFTNFADLSGTTEIISRAVSGVVALATGPAQPRSHSCSPPLPAGASSSEESVPRPRWHSRPDNREWCTVEEDLEVDARRGRRGGDLLRLSGVHPVAMVHLAVVNSGPRQ